MPPVGDLHRVRRAGAGALGVGAGPVPADHLARRDARAARRRACRPRGRGAGPPAGGCPCRSAPCRTRARGAARSRPPRAPPPSPTCGSGSPRIIRSSVRRLAASPSRGAEPGAGPTGQRQPDRGEHPAQPDAAPGIPAGQPRDLLGEGPLRTVRGVAEEPPYPERDRHRRPADRGVGHPTSVAAVHPRRTRPAPGTAAFPSDRGRGDHHPTREPLDPARPAPPSSCGNSTPSDSRSHPRT